MKLSTTFTAKLVNTNTKMVGNSQASPSSYNANDFTKFVTKPKFIWNVLSKTSTNGSPTATTADDT